MALAAQNQVRNLFIGLDYPEFTTVSALKAGTNGDIALLSADGTVAACLKGDSRHCCYSCHIVVAITISKLHSTTDR